MDSVQEKQKFLRQSVLEKGLDQQAFCCFMQARKENWDDLQNWTSEELIALVHDYQTYSRGQPAAVPPPEHDYQIVTEKQATDILMEKQERIYYDRYKTYEPPMTKVVRVEKLVKERKERPSVYIDRVFTHLVGGIFGLGQSEELCYSIKFPEHKWEVVRTTADLVWFSESLKVHFPYQFVPVFKAYKRIPKTRERAQKRIKMASVFVEELTMIEEVYHSKLFQNFFSLPSKDEFQNFKRSVNNLKFLKIAHNIASPTGSHTLRLSKNHNIFAQEIEKAATRQQPILAQIDRQATEIANDVIKLSGSILKLAELVRHVQRTYSDFNNSIGEGRVEQPNKLFIGLNGCLIEWGKEVEQMASVFSTRFRCMFKQCKQDKKQLVDMLRRRTQAEEEFLKFKTALELKRDRLFQVKDLSKWEIPKELREKAVAKKEVLLENKSEAVKYICAASSSHEGSLRDWYAFLSESCFRGGQQFVGRTMRRLARELIQFSDQLRHSLHQQKEAVGQLKQVGVLGT